MQVPDQVTFILKERLEADYYESFILKEYGLATASEGNVLSIFFSHPTMANLLPFREAVAMKYKDKRSHFL